MKDNKAVVLGGSSGIGLAVSKKLIDRGYNVIVLSRHEPEKDILAEGKYSYIHFDLLEMDEDILTKVIEDVNVSVLFISAGIGRVADFEYFHPAEISKIMTTNATATIQCLRYFYERIKEKNDFYCGVMGSIAGMLSSPMASVYAASKAAICRFIESVNVELEESGTNNRILNISPGSFKGTRFYGGNNQIELLESLSEEIINRLLRRDTIFIPQYDDIYKAVLERYFADPHSYGLYSYQYKKESNRSNNGKVVKIGYLSGTFDLFHIGHLNILRRAKAECDYLIVGVHGSGAWKGKETFIPLEERKEIVAACKYVDKVVDSCPEDSDAWYLWHYDKLFVGSDYKNTERFNRYEDFFKDKGVEIVYFPYTQSTSSTQIRKTVLLKTKDIQLEC